MGNTNCCYSKFARPSSDDRRGEKRKEKGKKGKHKRVDVGGGSDAKVTKKLFKFVE